MIDTAQRQIVLGVTGGIAAYKSADLCRRLIDHGCQIRVVMTDGAREFVTPLTMQAVSGNPVHTSLLDEAAEAGMGHIETCPLGGFGTDRPPQPPIHWPSWPMA